jgi:hypothetical protein
VGVGRLGHGGHHLGPAGSTGQQQQGQHSARKEKKTSVILEENQQQGQGQHSVKTEKENISFRRKSAAATGAAFCQNREGKIF